MDGLTTSLIAWKQFESGLSEFKEALGKDKGALKGLTGALEMVNEDGNTLAYDVKEVAKRLSEKIESHQQHQLHQQQVKLIFFYFSHILFGKHFFFFFFGIFFFIFSYIGKIRVLWYGGKRI